MVEEVGIEDSLIFANQQFSPKTNYSTKGAKMNLNLKDRVALVTGGSRGIGLSIAMELGKAGSQIAICSKTEKHLDAAEKKLKAAGIKVLPILADVTHADAAKRTVELIIHQWSALDILVNNAGGLPKQGSFFDLSDQDWFDAMDLNLISMVRFCRVAIPYLKKSLNPRIINLSSIVARQPGVFNPHYSAAKIAVLNFTKHLAGLLASDRILVNGIVPGSIHTDGWDEYLEQKANERGKSLADVSEEENAKAKQNIPIGRLGLPQEIAAIAVFLASDAAGFITGSEIVADGGKFKVLN